MAFWALWLALSPIGLAQAPAAADQARPCDQAKKGVLADLTSPQVKELVRACAPLILDVRTPPEYRSGHIPGAKLIPLQDLEKRIHELQSHRQEPILVYCRSGNRSRLAASILRHFGFKQVYHLNRGIIEWNRFGYPIER